ncbi:MAG: hypothetical protein WEG56_09355 [Chloroflexota bacterium]
MARVRPSIQRASSADAVTFSRQLPGQRAIVAVLVAVALLAGVTGVRAALSWVAHPGPGASRAAGLDPADLVVVTSVSRRYCCGARLITASSAGS